MGLLIQGIELPERVLPKPKLTLHGVVRINGDLARTYQLTLDIEVAVVDAAGGVLAGPTKATELPDADSSCFCFSLELAEGSPQGNHFVCAYQATKLMAAMPTGTAAVTTARMYVPIHRRG